MEHKERIALYLSGLADAKKERQTENTLRRDSNFLECFVETVEQRLCTAPPDFAASVMRLLPDSPAAAVKVPVLSRKLCAAACFCSAAVIMLLTVSGLNQYFFELLTAHSGVLDEWITFAQNLISGGK